jgi:hypothetical protein
MKKFSLILMVCLMATTALAAVQQQIQFVDDYGLPMTDVSWVKITTAGLSSSPTIYKERSLTNAITNPMTPSTTNTGLLAYNGLVQFFTRSGVTVDVQAMVGGAMVKAWGLGASDTQITVGALDRLNSVRKKGSFDNFLMEPMCTAKLGAGAATGTAGDENLMYTGANLFEYHIVGTATVVAPTRIATGLSIGLDVADNDGIEISTGILNGNQSAFTVGTDGPFSFKCRFDIADVSGSDQCMVGLRKVAAYNVDPDSYTDFAALDVVSGTIKPFTNLNGGTAAYAANTDAWADGATKTLGVHVTQAGVVTFTINGVAPTVTKTFTFDTGDQVMPFFYNRYDTTTPGVIYIEEWDCGLD